VRYSSEVVAASRFTANLIFSKSEWLAGETITWMVFLERCNAKTYLPGIPALLPAFARYGSCLHTWAQDFSRTLA
jgi:hypothetical protein